MGSTFCALKTVPLARQPAGTVSVKREERAGRSDWNHHSFCWNQGRSSVTDWKPKTEPTSASRSASMTFTRDSS